MSRTKIGVRLTLISTFSTIIIALISFLRIPLIINYYGTEQNGIMQVAVQITTYLILLESGITAAYQFKMYSNIRNNNIQKLVDLYFGLKSNMKFVGVKMLMISIFFVILYPALINRVDVTYIDSMLILITILLRYISPYFLTLSQRGLISTFEKQYLDDLIQLISNILVFVFEYILIILLKPPLFIVLLVSVFFIFLSSIIYNRIVEKLIDIKNITSVNLDMTPKSMTKDIFIHQFSSIVFYNTDNVVLSVFRSLNEVTIYSAFSTLINFPVQFINKIISGLKSSLALKIQGEESNTYHVFGELLSVTCFISSIIIPIFYLMSNKFIELWIGQNYNVQENSVFLFCLIILNRMIMPVIIAVRDSKGLYRESRKFTILQTGVNLFISILLVSNYGIPGILAGTVFSMYIVAMPLNANLIKKEVFHNKIGISNQLVKITICFIIMLFLSNLVHLPEYGWISFIKETTILTFLNTLVSFIIFYISDEKFRYFVGRFIFYKEKRRD